MKEKRKKTTEDSLYIIGLVSIFIMLMIAWVVKRYSLLDRLVIPCGFRMLTGYYCPGCGGTRAVRYFLQGHLLKSFLYHPMVPYIGIGGGIFMVRQTLHYLSRGKLPPMKFQTIYIYGLGAIIFVQFVIKNLLLMCWGIEIIG